MGRERTIQAALRLHHDASLIMTNIQILSQLATSFSRAASEVEPFPTEAVDLVTPGRPVRSGCTLHGGDGPLATNERHSVSGSGGSLVLQFVYGV